MLSTEQASNPEKVKAINETYSRLKQPTCAQYTD